MTTLREMAGNLWHFHEQDAWIAVATNGTVNGIGQAVMGAGQAKDASNRFPNLPRILGDRLRQFGNQPAAFPHIRLITWPTKRDWRSGADLTLIINGVSHIRHFLDQFGISRLYCPRPGCGLGQLQWERVRRALAPLVDDRFIFVTFPQYHPQDRAGSRS